MTHALFAKQPCESSASILPAQVIPDCRVVIWLALAHRRYGPCYLLHAVLYPERATLSVLPAPQLPLWVAYAVTRIWRARTGRGCVPGDNSLAGRWGRLYWGATVGAALGVLEPPCVGTQQTNEVTSSIV